WQEFRMTYTTPAGTDSIEVLINVMRQHSKARAWVDDISVIRIPVKPLESTTTVAPDAQKDAPPEE
ncbi:MAG: hypothetical protein QME62_14405, partial [Armatimonadota bacterium]|nr:hypothetical protein [Armatimonadota bacterium]